MVINYPQLASEQSQVQENMEGSGRCVGIIGIPLDFGAEKAGVGLGPAAIRIARLGERIETLGYRVTDMGDVHIGVPHAKPAHGEPLRYLREVKAACKELARRVEDLMERCDVPLVIGGDHSISIGSISGVASYFHKREQAKLGLIWVDAHADMNTPETTPSGNIHGMPLAILLGYGTPELTHIADFSPKLEPQFCVHLGARDIDAGERKLIKQLGLRFITMREIDERGMNACIDEAVTIASRAAAGFHLTLDIDSLDPTDAPGSGTIVRGGLTYREAHLAMEKIAETRKMRSMDIVEINTTLDINNKTAELGVELVLSALGKTIL